MASWKPEIYSGDGVLDYYRESDAVMFKVYAGTKPDQAYLRYFFDKTDQRDKSEGERILSDALMAIKANPQNTNPYLLEIIVKAKGRGSKPQTSNITFQLNQPPSMLGGYGMMQQPATDPALVQLLAKVTEQNNLIISKLSEDEIEEEEGDQLGSVPASPLEKLLNTPKVQEALGTAIGNFVSKVLGVGDDNKKVPMLSGGVEDAEQLRTAIERLKKHESNIGFYLSKLADIADNDPQTFQLMLVQLKAL